MRVQFVLQVTDDKLVDKLIQPYYYEHELNNLISECLSAYYYVQEVKDIIDGKKEPEDTAETVQAHIDGIRADTATQELLVNELQKTIEAGTLEVSEILNRTNEVSKSGVAKTTQTEYGVPVLRVEQHNFNTDVKRPEPKQEQSDDILKILVIAVKKLAEASGNSETVALLNNTDLSGVVNSSPKNSNDAEKIRSEYDVKNILPSYMLTTTTSQFSTYNSPVRCKPGWYRNISFELDDDEVYYEVVYKHKWWYGSLNSFVVELLSAYYYNEHFRELVVNDAINAKYTNVKIPDEFKKDPSILDITTDRKFALIRPEYIKKDLTKYVGEDSHTYHVARFTQVLAKWLVLGVDASRLSADEQSILQGSYWIDENDIVDIYDILNCNVVEFDLGKASLQEVAI